MNTVRTFFHRLRHTISRIRLTTPVAIILAALILGGSHIVYGLVVSGTQQKQVSYFAGKPIDTADHIEGNAKNGVYIVEYSDPECPYCISLHPTMKQLRTEYESKVAFVYRYFPLTQIHPHAFDESKAIACAASIKGTQGFYQYIDTLYGYKIGNQTTQLPENGKEDIAKNIGIEKTQFDACMKDKATDMTIDSSVNDGVQAGVEGTPSTFILKETRKGYEVVAMIDGARPYDYFKAAIDEALSR